LPTACLGNRTFMKTIRNSSLSGMRARTLNDGAIYCCDTDASEGYKFSIFNEAASV
jgi:hypothetical protein